jgi:hypothetical protein
MQLTEHGLFRTFAPVNATLWKLPTVGAYALAPENLVFLVEQNDADVRPKAFTVKHNQPQIFLIVSIMHGVPPLALGCFPDTPARFS